MKILIMVAHPDDEAIMCSGTIDKLIKQKHEVSVTYFTCNDQAYFKKETQNQRKMRAMEEAKKSAKLLGYKTNFLHFVDMMLEKDKGLLIQTIIKEIRRTEPDIIITHHETDKHIDHRTLGTVVPEANFQSGCDLCGGNKKWKARAVLQGEVDLEMTTPFDFQVISNISNENLANKVKAFKCYESVNNEHKTSQDWLINKLRMCAELRGQAANYKYGEAFRISNYSPLNANDLINIVEIIR